MAVEYGPLEDRFPLRTGGELHFREYFRECVCFFGGGNCDSRITPLLLPNMVIDDKRRCALSCSQNVQSSNFKAVAS